MQQFHNKYTYFLCRNTEVDFVWSGLEETMLMSWENVKRTAHERVWSSSFIFDFIIRFNSYTYSYIFDFMVTFKNICEFIGTIYVAQIKCFRVFIASSE